MTIPVKTVTIPGQALYKLLVLVKPTLRSIGLEALSCVHLSLLEVDPPVLEVGATNLELGILYRIPADVIGEGEFNICVSVKALLSFVERHRKKGAQVTITYARDTMQVMLTSEGSTITLKGISGDEFPVIPALPDVEPLRIAPEAFVAGARVALSAVATADNRPLLTGVQLWEETKGRLTFAGADGYWLAVDQHTIDSPIGADLFQAVVPGKSMETLVKLVSNHLTSSMSLIPLESTWHDDQRFKIKVEEPRMAFHVGEHVFYTMLVPGKFPVWRELLDPAKSKRTAIISFPRDAALDAVKSVLSIAHAAAETTKLRAWVENDKTQIEISSKIFERGEIATRIQGGIIDGQRAVEIKIDVNGQYLYDAIAACETEIVALGCRPIVRGEWLAHPRGQERRELTDAENGMVRAPIVVTDNRTVETLIMIMSKPEYDHIMFVNRAEEQQLIARATQRVAESAQPAAG